MSQRADSDVARIVLCGATGRTGNAVAHALVEHGREWGVELTACVAPSVASGAPTRPLPGGMPAFASLSSALDEPSIDQRAPVVVDLSLAESARHHVGEALRRQIPIVVGATGFAEGEFESIAAPHVDAGLGIFLVPNFSLGVAMLLKLADIAVAAFPAVEVIETHHDGKRDAPSGTARHTASRLAAAGARGVDPAPAGGDGTARGELIDGVPVHAIRVPGASAHQEVVFGGAGELLTLRHDAIDRSCYAHGVALAARAVRTMRGLTTGLEHVL